MKTKNEKIEEKLNQIENYFMNESRYLRLNETKAQINSFVEAEISSLNDYSTHETKFKNSAVFDFNSNKLK